jgi:hypothetical protein
MATNTSRGMLTGKSATRIDDVWAEDANDPTDPRIKTLVQLMRDGASEEIQQLAEAELSNMGYFDGRMTRSRLIQGELFSEEEIL